MKFVKFVVEQSKLKNSFLLATIMQRILLI